MHIQEKHLIARDISHSEKSMLYQLIFNKYGIETYFLLGQNFSDTDYRYDMYVEGKISQRLLDDMILYTDGLRAGRSWN